MKTKKLYFLYLLCLITICAVLFFIGRYSVHHDAGRYRAIYTGERRAMLYTQSMQLKQCDILVIGDSLIDGMYFTSKKKEVFLSGVGGATVEDWLAWAPRLFQNLKSAKLMIALGINNADRNKKFNLEEFILNYQALCTLAEKQGIENIVIISLLPVGKNEPLGNAAFNSENITQINVALEQLAKSKGYTYIDSYNKFVNTEGFMPTEFTTDGVHLTAEGYSLWKEILFPNL